MGDCDKADALAAVADRARVGGQDVVIVMAGGAVEPLAAALDRRIGRGSRRRDPFGARARIEVVEDADLFDPGLEPAVEDWRDVFASLAARNDIVLVDLPAAGRLATIGPLLAALDEAAILRAESEPAEDLLAVCAAAEKAGTRVTHQVVVASSRP